MSVKNNLRIVMAQKRIDSVSELMQLTGLSRNALNKLWHDDDIESVKLGTLIQVCDALDIKLSELMEYHPNKQKDRQSQL